MPILIIVVHLRSFRATRVEKLPALVENTGFRTDSALSRRGDFGHTKKKKIGAKLTKLPKNSESIFGGIFLKKWCRLLFFSQLTVGNLRKKWRVFFGDFSSYPGRPKTPHPVPESETFYVLFVTISFLSDNVVYLSLR